MSEGPYIWDKAWWRQGKDGYAFRAGGQSSSREAFVVRIPENYKVVSARGKYLVRLNAEGFHSGCAVPGETVPHIFDTLEEAQAVYDLIVDKE
jgi:hypothetical protein